MKEPLLPQAAMLDDRCCFLLLLHNSTDGPVKSFKTSLAPDVTTKVEVPLGFSMSLMALELGILM